jgi:hypothetical protein
MYCFGVCNNSPDSVLLSLKKKKYISDNSEVSVVEVGKTLSGKKPKNKFIFVLSIGDFLRNAEILNSKAYVNARVFVFASPIRINELDGIVPLDMEQDPTAKGFGFTLQSLQLSKYAGALKREQAQVKRNTRKHLTILTDSVKIGSLLAPLMTFIYSLPSSTLQTPTKKAVADILVNGVDLELISKLSISDKNALSVKAKQKLLSILESELGQKYIQAFKDYKKVKDTKGPTGLQSIAKKYEISLYELKYLLSVLPENNNKKKKE